MLKLPSPFDQNRWDWSARNSPALSCRTSFPKMNPPFRPLATGDLDRGTFASLLDVDAGTALHRFLLTHNDALERTWVSDSWT